MVTRLALAVALAPALVASGCDRPTFLTDLALSAERLDFVAPAGIGDPPSQRLYVTNPGAGKLARPEVTIAYAGAPGGWLAVTVSEDSNAPYRLEVAAAAGELAPGTHAATITVSSANASRSPVQLPVKLTVPAPSFEVDRRALVFVAPGDGVHAAPQTVNVTNGGRGTLPVPRPVVSYIGSQGWASVEVAGTPAQYAVTVRCSADGLPSGEHAATVTLTADGAEGTATFAVSLSVPAPAIAAGGGGVGTSGVFTEDMEVQPVSVEVRNVGGGFLERPQAYVEYLDGMGYPWMWVEVTGEAAPYQLVLHVNQHGPPAMTAGTHLANVHLSASGAVPATLSVSVNIPETRIEHPYVGWDVGRDCAELPPTVYQRIRKSGPYPLAKPTATVLDGAEGWLEAKVLGVRPPWTLGVRLKAAPPGSRQVRIRLEAPGVTAADATVNVRMPLDGAQPEIWPQVSAVALRAQLGLGDPGPGVVPVFSSVACLPPPGVEATFPDGTPPWITIGSRPGYLRQDVLIGATAAGMAPGEVRHASLALQQEAGSPIHLLSVSLTAGALRAVQPMYAARRDHALVVLQTGEVLAASGAGAAASTAERWDPVIGAWIEGPRLVVPRVAPGAVAHHQYALLVGGRTPEGPPTSTFEYWTADYPSLVTWPLQGAARPTVLPITTPGEFYPARYIVTSYPSSPMILETTNHTTTTTKPPSSALVPGSAVGLSDGRILTAGGTGGFQHAVAIFDPHSEEWTASEPLATVLGFPALELLPDGRVLAVGASWLGPAAELWDPLTGLWTPAATPAAEHIPGETVTLTSGKVLAFGGTKAAGAELTADIELYDPATDTWTVVGALPSPRRGVKVVRLPDGSVFAAGGELADGLPTAEAFAW